MLITSALVVASVQSDRISAVAGRTPVVPVQLGWLAGRAVYWLRLLADLRLGRLCACWLRLDRWTDLSDRKLPTEPAWACDNRRTSPSWLNPSATGVGHPYRGSLNDNIEKQEWKTRKGLADDALLPCTRGGAALLEVWLKWLSEQVGLNVPRQHIVGHFGDESFQSVTCTGTDNLTRTTKRQNTQITQNYTTQKVALANKLTDTLKKSRLRDRIDRARFSRLVRHPARKQSGSILWTPQPG